MKKGLKWRRSPNRPVPAHPAAEPFCQPRTCPPYPCPSSCQARPRAGDWAPARDVGLQRRRPPTAWSRRACAPRRVHQAVFAGARGPPGRRHRARGDASPPGGAVPGPAHRLSRRPGPGQPAGGTSHAARRRGRDRGCALAHAPRRARPPDRGPDSAGPHARPPAHGRAPGQGTGVRMPAAVRGASVVGGGRPVARATAVCGRGPRSSAGGGRGQGGGRSRCPCVPQRPLGHRGGVRCVGRGGCPRRAARGV